jgi:hypothetical protein
MNTCSYDDQLGATDQDLDAVEPTPFGLEFINGLLNATAVMDGLGYDGLSITQTLELRAGNYYNSAAGSTNYTLRLIGKG